MLEILAYRLDLDSGINFSITTYIIAPATHSGKFCKPIPITNAIAPYIAVPAKSNLAVPKATTIDNPSEMLCNYQHEDVEEKFQLLIKA